MVLYLHMHAHTLHDIMMCTLLIDVFLHFFLVAFNKLLYCLLTMSFSIAIRKRESLGNMPVYLLRLDIHTINDRFIIEM